MAAGTCLSLMAGAVMDAIVPHVIPFIEAHIKSQDWHFREAAVMAFGSILEGPDPIVLTPLVNQALPLLIDMMLTDTNIHVKDTTAWTLGRICDLLVQTIKPDNHLNPLITALVNSLQDSPRIVANCCWALMNLADQLSLYYEEEGENVTTGPLSPYFEGVVQALLRITETYVPDPPLSSAVVDLRILALAMNPISELPPMKPLPPMSPIRHPIPYRSCRTPSLLSCNGWSIF